MQLGRIDRLLKATEDTELFGLFSVERRIGACDESDGSLGVAREVTNRAYKVRESEHGQDPVRNNEVGRWVLLEECKRVDAGSKTLDQSGDIHFFQDDLNQKASPGLSSIKAILSVVSLIGKTAWSSLRANSKDCTLILTV